LAYVARFATSRKKLADYLRRKVRERGWEGEEDVPIGEIVERIGALGYVDDAAFAMSKAQAMRSRGFGARRVSAALSVAGIEGDDRERALDCDDRESIAAALKFARRKRIGPFSDRESDRVQREKWLAAMLRAGHGLDLSRRIILLPAGIEPEPEQLLG
jgi:regulatory protein